MTKQLTLFDKPAFRDAVTPRDGLAYAIYRAELYKQFLEKYECVDEYNILSTLIGMLREDANAQFTLYCPTEGIFHD